MTNPLRQRCEMFVRNRDVMKNNFKWDNAALHPLCASLYTDKGLNIDRTKIELGKRIIKDNTGVFSNFRSTTFLLLATMLSLENNPENTFQEVLKTYEILKKEFFVSGYLPLSAYVMANMVDSFDYVNVVRKSKDIYQKMKKEHPFLTSSEDSGFAVMFAISDLSVNTAITEMEKCYNILHKKFLSANAVQALSHTLALGEEDSQKKCNKVIEIIDQLKSKECKYGSGVELAVLGVLAMTTDNTAQTVNDILEVNEYLLSSKGFGPLGTGKAQRVMYSAILVAQEYKKQCLDHIMDMATINSVTHIIIAQQIAVSAAIAASASASAASN